MKSFIVALAIPIIAIVSSSFVPTSPTSQQRDTENFYMRAITVRCHTVMGSGIGNPDCLRTIVPLANRIEAW